jgi:hypothetical protein
MCGSRSSITGAVLSLRHHHTPQPDTDINANPGLRDISATRLL